MCTTAFCGTLTALSPRSTRLAQPLLPPPPLTQQAWSRGGTETRAVIYTATALCGARRKWSAISFESTSSDGTHLRFTLRAADTLSFSLWEVSLDGTGLCSLLPATFHQDPGECCGKWTPDGRYYFFSAHKGRDRTRCTASQIYLCQLANKIGSYRFVFK